MVRRLGLQHAICIYALGASTLINGLAFIMCWYNFK
jgi:hypothetical protein